MDPNLKTIVTERVEQKSNPNITKYLNPKVIFGVLGAIILIEIVFGISTLMKDSSPTQVTPEQAIVGESLTDGSISLSASSTSIKIGQKVTVSVNISTGGHEVLGGDVILKYNPKLLSLTNTDIQTGLAFSAYPLVEVDSKEGIIRISGVAEGQNFKGDFNIANISFTAKAVGVESVTIEYKEGDSRDSNLVSSEGVDILKKTKDVNIEITP